MGGVDIGNFHHHKLALLAKWVWRFLSEHDALWSTYCCKTSFD